VCGGGGRKEKGRERDKIEGEKDRKECRCQIGPSSLERYNWTPHTEQEVSKDLAGNEGSERNMKGREAAIHEQVEEG